MFHYCVSTDNEIDIILEMPSGKIVGIEIKTGANLNRVAALDKKMFAVPISRIWE